MRKIIAILTAALTLLSCQGGEGEYGTVDPAREYRVGACVLDLRESQGGMVTSGTYHDGRKIEGADVRSQELVDGYVISASPVSQALWTEVMGRNPSSTVNPSLPVDMVSCRDIERFLTRLSKLTGVGFILPDEAVWEHAVLNGLISPDRGQREICTCEGAMNVVRTRTTRQDFPEYAKAGATVFRIAAPTGKVCPEEIANLLEGGALSTERSCVDEKISVGDAVFDMVAVKGGEFWMGATDIQKQYAEDDERPLTRTIIEDFEISRTEVTVAQWLAVMGSLPYGNYTEYPNKPVVNVSWYAAQEFVLRLRDLSGRKFRLPYESEWEYAAKGGRRSQDYRYSGSNQVVAVAVHQTGGSDRKVHDVASLSPNELGLYDMSGNAWEWCQDSYSLYGYWPEDIGIKVLRGGSAASTWEACRVSNRSAMPAVNVKSSFGFRLAI